MTTRENDDFGRILASAERLNFELDAEAAQHWIEAIKIAATEEETIAHDIESGVFGHKIALLDFSDNDLAHFRYLGQLVEFSDVPGKVETALALSGSAAQSKVQTYPGDADYFERVNIITDTREEACAMLGQLMRDKALNTLAGDTYQLIEAKFGSFDISVYRNGKHMAPGTPISWTPAEITAGYIVVHDEEERAQLIQWDDVAQEPGWCKLDWVVVDPQRRRLANASNMLDVTWEAPDGTITPLDGYLDGYFQEIYLEAESVPIFNKLVKQMTPDTLDSYVARLEKEVVKYSGNRPNYGKAAKRLYNVFRMTGRYYEAAYLRELFDEPAALLYQVWALVRTIDDLVSGSTHLSVDDIIAQTDDLIMSVIKVLEGDEELEIVRQLLQLEHSLCRPDRGDQFNIAVTAARDEALNIINNFFQSRLHAVPTIKSYLTDLHG